MMSGRRRLIFGGTTVGAGGAGIDIQSESSTRRRSVEEKALAGVGLVGPCIRLAWGRHPACRFTGHPCPVFSSSGVTGGKMPRICLAECRGPVAQTASLLYRRLAACGALKATDALELATPLPTASRRYSRLTTCATR